MYDFRGQDCQGHLQLPPDYCSLLIPDIHNLAVNPIRIPREAGFFAERCFGLGGCFTHDFLVKQSSRVKLVGLKGCLTHELLMWQSALVN